jgi:signal transduction histidine kinase
MRQALLEGHIGLAAVSERVAALRGTFSITTALGAGTTVRVTLPDARVKDQPDHARAQRQDSADTRERKRSCGSIAAHPAARA